VYVIGKTGMGKSTLLENMAVQDIKFGDGLAFIDPHGKTAELLLDYVPEERIKDVLYFAPFDLEHPVSFNVMEDVGMEKRHLVSSGLMSAFKKIWVDAWSARMEYILNNILLALLEYPGSTLIGVNRMLADKDDRKKVVDNVSDPAVHSCRVDEFAKYGERYMQEAGAAIQNKIGQFVSNPVVRNLIGQPKSSFDIRKMMDEKKILIINLSKGRVGEANANLLGSMIITKVYLAAMSRAELSPAQMKLMPNFYLYVDEFQSFANESFADILSEARKYKLNLTMAHQYIEQMSEEVRAAVFGNVGTMITFRVGAYDAEVLEKEFAPQFEAEDLVNLGAYQLYLKLMIDGVSSQPFSASSLPPIAKPETNNKDRIIDSSRQQFSRPRNEVEEAIRIWHEPIQVQARTASQPAIDRPRSDRSPQKSVAVTTPASPAAPAPARPPAIQSPVASQRARDDREKALRQTISLSYRSRIEDEKRAEEQKKTDARKKEFDDRRRSKEASTQNMSALRDALTTVLAQSQTQPESQPQPAADHHPVQKKEFTQTNVTSNTTHINTVNVQPERQAPAPPPRPQQVVPPRQHKKEISPDALKKVLTTPNAPRP